MCICYKYTVQTFIIFFCPSQTISNPSILNLLQFLCVLTMVVPVIGVPYTPVLKYDGPAVEKKNALDGCTEENIEAFNSMKGRLGEVLSEDTVELAYEKEWCDDAGLLRFL